jgi:hypothetical protein
VFSIRVLNSFLYQCNICVTNLMKLVELANDAPVLKCFWMNNIVHGQYCI